MINQIDSLPSRALAAMKAAVQGVVEEHRRRNRPLSSWANGRVVYRDPHTLKIVREDPVRDEKKG